MFSILKKWYVKMFTLAGESIKLESTKSLSFCWKSNLIRSIWKELYIKDKYLCVCVCSKSVDDGDPEIVKLKNSISRFMKTICPFFNELISNFCGSVTLILSNCHWNFSFSLLIVILNTISEEFPIEFTGLD